MLTVSIDAAGLDADLSDLAERQIPFAAAAALNTTAKQFQKVEVEHIAATFTLRRPTWIQNSVKITKFASKTDPVATVGIHPPGGDARADVLGKFETDTEKRPTAGLSVAVPLAARATPASLIPSSLRPRNLDFHEVGGAALAVHAGRLSSKRLRGGVLRGAFRVLEGDNRTILIQSPTGGGVILQRVGRGKREGLRVLYTLAPSVHITPDLLFHANAEAVFASAFLPNFEAAFAQALSSARGGGLTSDGASLG